MWRLKMLGCALLVFLGAMKPLAEARPRYHPEDFFFNPSMSPPLISPDGESVLYTRDRRGYATIFRHEIGRRRPKVVFQTASESTVFTDLQWISPERIVYQENQGSIYAVNVDGTDRVELLDADGVLFVGFGFFFGNLARPSILHPLPEEPLHLLVSRFNRRGKREVLKINHRNGESEVVVKGDSRVTEWIVAPDGQVLGGHSYERRGFNLLYRPTAQSRWKSIDTRLSKADLPGRFRYDRKSVAGKHQRFLGFGSNAGEIFFVSNHETDRFALYRLDLRGDTSVEKLFEDPIYDLDLNMLGSLPRMIFDRGKDTLVGLVYTAQTPTTVWFDAEWKQRQAAIDALRPGFSNFILDSDLARERWIVSSHSSTEPCCFLLYDETDGTLDEIARLTPRLDPEALAPPEPVQIPTPDGHPLYGYLTRPRDAQPGVPAPLVMWLHGGPWVRGTGLYDPMVQFLAYEGYAVLQVNFRGSTGYGFAHLDAARKRYGRPAMEDVMIALDWAIDQGVADPGRVALGGHSYGAYLTAFTLAHHSDRFRCGIGFSGLYDLVEQTDRLLDEHKGQLSVEHWKAVVGKNSDREELEAMSPYYQVDGITRPLLLVHGTADETTVFADSEALAAALEKNGIEHELVELVDGDHGYTDMRHRVHACERALRFLHAHLPLEPEPDQ